MLILDRVIIYRNESIYMNNTLIGFEKRPTGFLCHILFNGFNIYNDWEIHVIIYPTISFIIMFILNLLLIKKTYNVYKKKVEAKTRSKSVNNITLSLIFITMVYMIMCLPSVVAYQYFYSYFHSNEILMLIIHLLDAIGFMNRASIFINCMISNIRFRRVILRQLKFVKSKEDISVTPSSKIISRRD